MPLATDWIIRPILATDAAFADEVFYHGLYNLGETPPPRDVMQHPLLRIYLDGFPRSSDFGFVGEQRATGQPIGCVYARYFDHDKHGLGYQDVTTPELSIGVMPEFRGSGCGSMLMQSICAYADAHRIDISLNCHEKNPAHRLYERNGFCVVASRPSGDLMFRRHGA